MGRKTGNRAGRKAIEREASLWVARHSLGELDAADAREFGRWKSEPEHAAAFDRLSAALASVNSAGPVARAAHHRALRATRQRQRRLFATGAALSLVAALTIPQLDLPSRFADVHTGRGEIRRMTLADGSRLWLDADSAADIVLDGGSRDLSLVRGRLHVEVAHEARPFIVHAAGGAVHDLGTGFDVEETDRGAETIVTQGRVLAEAGGARVELRAGEGAAWDKGSLPYRLDHGIPIGQPDWRDGRLRFDRQPLSDVVSALDRYSRKRLILWNDQAGRKVVSGLVNAHQADREIAALAQSQGLSTTDLGFAIILR